MNESIARVIAENVIRKALREPVTDFVTTDSTPYDMTFPQAGNSLMFLDLTVLGIADDGVSGRIVYKSKVIADLTTSLTITENPDFAIDNTITGADVEVLSVDDQLTLRMTGYADQVNWVVIVEKWNVNANPIAL